MSSLQSLFDDLARDIESRGVHVVLRPMDVEKPGEFDGLTITINPVHDLEARSYYLAHSFGSIVQWSTGFDRAKRVFDEIRDAKAVRTADPERFERALAAYCRFEAESSEHAVWMLTTIHHEAAIQPYTVFFRADIQAMTIFHRTGEAPKWPEFYADWKQKIRAGEITVEPFPPKPVPRFQPVRIEQQEVLQERD